MLVVGPSIRRCSAHVLHLRIRIFAIEPHVLGATDCAQPVVLVPQRGDFPRMLRTKLLPIEILQDDALYIVAVSINLPCQLQEQTHAGFAGFEIAHIRYPKLARLKGVGLVISCHTNAGAVLSSHR